MLAAAAFVGTLGVGCCPCQVTSPVAVKTPSPVAPNPGEDEATEMRQWPRSLALYHSGATPAWPTRWYYAPNPDNTTVENFIFDPVMFVFQTVTIPATIIPDYPFRQVVYAGDVAPLSYTGLPPLPPERSMSVGNADPDPLVAPSPEPLLPPIPPVPIERFR